MRKPLATRIFGLAVLYCAVFFFLVILQFSNRENFSLSVGNMSVRGRYLDSQRESSLYQEAIEANYGEENLQMITGGVKIYYGGLEFSLSEDRGKGLALAGTDDTIMPVNPYFLIVTGNTARFGLPGGTVLTLSSSESSGDPELRISVDFAQDVSEVTIPITPRRSSLVRDNDLYGIVYSGSRYFFTGRGQELENGRIVLSRGNTFISYRARGRQQEFDPANFITAQSQNYESELANWRNSNFTRWNQNTSALQNEDDIIAFLSEALSRGNFPAALAAIPAGFANSARHSYRSSGFVGGMSNAYRTFTAAENEKLNRVTRLTREGSLDVFIEENILDYLFTRSSTVLANDILDIVQNTSPEMLSIDYCPGLLEIYSDTRRWQPSLSDPIEHLTEQILLLVSENLNRDTDGDFVFASNSEDIDLTYTLRLGKALILWATRNENAEWEAIGKSLVLSALSNAGTNAGEFFNMLNPADNYPRAAWLTDTGHWAWTVSSSLRASYIEGNLNVAVSYPTGMSHHIIIRGVRPFIKLQIHDMDWRTDSQFERYDSSGWVYYPQEQILILKLRHRTTVENVRIFYRVEAPPPPPAPVETTEPETNDYYYYY